MNKSYLDIRGAAVEAADTTEGRFYQVEFPSGNVYFVKRLNNFNHEFLVVEVVKVSYQRKATPVGDVMDRIDTGKLFKFTQRPAPAKKRDEVSQEQPEMLAYPKDTTAKDIGAKAGDQFIVVDPRPGTKRGDILTLSSDDGSTCPFFNDASGKLQCTFWSRLAPFAPAVPAPVKPIRAAIQIGDRVVYDASKHQGGVDRLTGTHGTVLNVLNQSDEVWGVITVRWDNGEENGHSPACILPVVDKPVTMAEAHEELESTPAAPVDPVTACKSRIDAAKAEIERLASEQRVADKVLRDAQDDLRKELKGYLPEPQAVHPFDDILRHLNKQAGAGIGGRGLLGFPFGGL